MLVSILMPTYNRADLIGESIESVLAQSHTLFELIITDDGSSDHTEEVVRQYKDERIRYFKIPHSGFLSKVRNEGLKQAKGDFIAFIDSDDIWMPQKLQKQLDVLINRPEPGFVFSDVIEFNASATLRDGIYSAKTQSQFNVPSHVFRELIECRLVIYPSTLLMSKACIESTGFFDERLIASDILYVGRASSRFKSLLLTEKLVKIRKHATNHSIQQRGHTFSELFALIDYLAKAEMIGKKTQKGARFTCHKLFGIERYRDGFPDEAIKAFSNCLSLRFWSAKSWTWLLRSKLKSVIYYTKTKSVS